jgi:hypothetical protein
VLPALRSFSPAFSIAESISGNATFAFTHLITLSRARERQDVAMAPPAPRLPSRRGTLLRLAGDGEVDVGWCGRRFHFRELWAGRGDRPLTSYGIDLANTPFAAARTLHLITLARAGTARAGRGDGPTSFVVFQTRRRLAS